MTDENRYRCKTCKWWGLEEATYCESPKIAKGGWLAEGDTARAGGFEGYGDYFQTGPDFGCIHWEAIN